MKRAGDCVLQILSCQVTVNGSVHTACEQHERICAQICVLASSVDWVWFVSLFTQKKVTETKISSLC